MEKVYKFSNSKSLSFEIFAITVIFGFLAYLHLDPPFYLAAIGIFFGFVNAIYYVIKISKQEIQLRIEPAGITLKDQFISWIEIENIQIEKVDSENTTVKYLKIESRHNDHYNLDIDELNVSQKKLEKLISVYINRANS